MPKLKGGYIMNWKDLVFYVALFLLFVSAALIGFIGGMTLC